MFLDDKAFTRFYSKVVLNKDTGCLEWNAAKDKDGYGQFMLDYKVLKAHRLAYEDRFGEIKNGLHVLHKCDNRCCVNPHHLYLGTHEDNMRDLVNKNLRLMLSKNAI